MSVLFFCWSLAVLLFWIVLCLISGAAGPGTWCCRMILCPPHRRDRAESSLS